MYEQRIQPTQLLIPLETQHAYQSVIAPHCHGHAQLLYPSAGSIRVHTPAHVWIVPTKCALWIPAHIEHSVVALSQVTLSTALVTASVAQALGSQCFLLQVSNLLRELLLRFNQWEQLSHQSPQTAMELGHALQQLILYEIQNADNFPFEIPWPTDKRLLTICTQLLEQPQQLKDLNRLSDQVGASPRTLIRLFQRETGLSYRTWVQHLHIALAIAKLARGKSVADIAQSLGYQNVCAFSSMFKRHIGKTPQQYKNEKHAEHMLPKPPLRR
ncbi:AraC family transcriptional regulator [Acinetobacter larvae]|uniref:AraC family transcriptional regulator n=1 Tax=Acinetobacter larvae TaxID=1789224 RepID=A0A1B2M3P9_9GAMM|nr:helix-turn-helix transcriptional regulator [Acinetobacter larvae]AOA59835.1 AraC family transcriptional regulator [Acinetobacter larvae]